MELKDLVGVKKLSGVDFNTEEVEIYGGLETAEVCRFKLDGKVYTAIQDPSDGYRSSMREILVSPRVRMKNKFAPVSVFCLHREQGRGYSSADILEIYDMKTAKLVLVVGTDNSDDYYPSWVASFTPESMAPNA